MGYGMGIGEVYRRYGLKFAVAGVVAALLLVGVLLLLGLPVRPWAWWLAFIVVSWPACGPLLMRLERRSRPPAVMEPDPARGLDAVGNPLPDNPILRWTNSRSLRTQLVLGAVLLPLICALMGSVATLFLTFSVARAGLVFALTFVSLLVLFSFLAARSLWQLRN